MITIVCCYTCRWFKNGVCVNLENWNAHKDPEEGCEEWMRKDLIDEERS